MAMDEHMSERKRRGSTVGLPGQGDLTEPMLLTEHVNFDAMIRDHVGAEDAGTGVFGSLHHTKNDLKPKAHRKKLTDPGDWVDEEEYDDPEYMKDREIHQDGLEAYLKGSPFEKYFFSLGSKFGSEFSDPDYRVVGNMKGLIRIMEDVDTPSLLDLKEVLKPQSVKVRLYILRALGLAAMDEGYGGQPGRSDPYLKIELGKFMYDGRDDHFDDLTDVDFYTYVGLNTEIPGTGILKIHCYDYDDFGGDDLIGTTVIDLEDRWFDKRWTALGREHRVEDPELGKLPRWDVKPIENRCLYTPSGGTISQGTIEMWVELCRPSEDGSFPAADISLPPAVPCEARLIMFKAKECVAMDTLENMNDMYCTCWIEGTEKQNTDTHWRAKKGKASWNYRMKFDLNLVHNCTVLKFPYLHIQAWDADIIGSNDILAETVLDIKGPLTKVLKKQKAVEVFEDPPKPAEEDEIESDSESEEEEEDQGNPLLGRGLLGSSIRKKKHDEDEEEGSDEEGGETKNDDEPAVSATEAAKEIVKKQQEEKERQKAIEAGELDPDEGEETKKDQPVALEEGQALVKKKKKPKKKRPLSCGERMCHWFCCCCYWMKGCCGFCPISGFCQCCPICWDVHAVDEDDEAGAEADADAMEMVNLVKENMGVGGTDPKNCTWLTMDKLDHESGVRNQMGKMCIGLKLLPKSIADKEPAGFGRNDPNSNPTLPPPVGRMKFSLNPFVMGAELCGPKLCAQLTCCLVCLGVMALLIFCQPVLNLFIAIFLG